MSITPVVGQDVEHIVARQFMGRMNFNGRYTVRDN